MRARTGGGDLDCSVLPLHWECGTLGVGSIPHRTDSPIIPEIFIVNLAVILRIIFLSKNHGGVGLADNLRVQGVFSLIKL